MSNTVTLKLGITGHSTIIKGLSEVRASVTETFKGLSELAGPLLAGLAGVEGIRGVAEGFKQVVELGGKMHDQALQTGVAVGKLVEYRQALQDAGVGADSLGSVLARMERTIGEAFAHGGPAAEGIRDIGLNLGELAAMKPEEQFEKMREAIANLATPADRAAAAFQIFGKSGADLIPFFANGGILEEARRNLGQMPEVLARNADTLKGMGDAFEHIKTKRDQLFLGVLDIVGPGIAELVDKINDIDLTGVGQKIGAFVNLVIEKWRDGNIDVLIGDTIQAGFELGQYGVKKGFQALMDFLSGPGFWQGLGNAFVTTMYEGLKLVAHGFVALWQRQALALVDTMAPALKLVGKLAGVGPQEMMDRTKAEMMSFMQSVDKWADKRFDNATNAMRKLMGVGGTAGGTEDFAAAKRLADEIEIQLQKAQLLRDVEEATKGVEDEITAAYRTQNTLGRQTLDLKLLELEIHKQIAAFENQRSDIKGDWRKTGPEKYREENKVLKDQLAYLDKQHNDLMGDIGNESDPSRRDQLQKDLAGIDIKRDSTARELKNMGPNPDSFAEQWTDAFTKIKDGWGTVAQNIAKVGKDAFDGLTRTIGQGLDDMIWKTGSLRDLWKSFAHTLTSSVTQALSNMFMQWITGLFAKSAAQKAADLSETPGKTANALLDSISSWGVAAAVGGAALIAAMSLIGRESGGPVTAGQPYIVGERRAELFVPSQSGVILPRVEDMAMTGGAGGQNVTVSPAPVQVFAVTSTEDLLRALKESPKGQKVILDTVRGRKLELGISS